MSVFGKICSWAGICPGNNESGGKKKSGRSSKGNRYVKQLLCESANSAIRTKSRLNLCTELLVKLPSIFHLLPLLLKL
ncbi:MAG: IS110 family transposase [Nitrospirota bacterium]